MFRNSLKISLVISLGFLLSGCGIEGVRTDLIQSLANLQRSLGPIWQMLVALCYVLGVSFVATAILKLKQYGQVTVMMSTHAALGPSMAYLVIGVGLLFLPTLLDVMTVTLWGYGTQDITYGSDVGGSPIMIPVFQVIQVIGLISFMRGWLLLLKLGHQGAPPGTVSKGLMHMLGGIMAINISGTIDMLKASFGIL